jgi:hypothetical protein
MVAICEEFILHQQIDYFVKICTYANGCFPLIRKSTFFFEVIVLTEQFSSIKVRFCGKICK